MSRSGITSINSYSFTTHNSQLLTHLSFLIWAFPSSVGSGFPLQSFCHPAKTQRYKRIYAAILNAVIQVFRVFPPSPRPASAGWLPGRNFLSRYLQKSKYSVPRQKNCYCHPPDSYVYIIGSYGLGRKPISPLCTIGLKPSSHCLHQPFLPTLRTFPAVASRGSRSSKPRLSLHPQQQMVNACGRISLQAKSGLVRYA